MGICADVSWMRWRGRTTSWGDDWRYRRYVKTGNTLVKVPFISLSTANGYQRIGRVLSLTINAGHYERKLFVHLCQGSQPGSIKNPYSWCHDVIKKKFYTWQYRSAMNSWELPYYYHTFLFFSIKNWLSVYFGDTWKQIAYLWHHFTGKWVKT